MYTRRYMLAGLGVASLGAAGAAIVGGGATPQAGVQDRSIPNVELNTHTGSTVRFYDDLIRGKIVAINMMYAECGGICPFMTSNLVRVQAMLGERMGKDIFMYSISLRPERDSPQALADYAEMHHIRPGWLFLTGDRQNIERVRNSLGFYDPNPVVDKDLARHTGMIRIGNDAYDRWSMAPALADPEQIVSSIMRVVT